MPCTNTPIHVFPPQEQTKPGYHWLAVIAILTTFFIVAVSVQMRAPV